MSFSYKKENFKIKIRKFFFPFSPIKSFRSGRLLFLISILLALRIVLGVLSIRIAPFGLSISIAWVPLMVLGWYFGPVVGLFLGIITDTISFLMSGGGIWFWLYAIQEPIVGLLSGLIAGWCKIRQAKNKTKISFDIVLNQIFVLGFAVVAYVVLIAWLNSSVDFDHRDQQFEQFYKIYEWIAISGISLLIIIYEVLTILTLTKKIGEKNHHIMINFIYSSCLVALAMLIFSIALGPITAVEYGKFIGLAPEEGYLKLGSLFYLIPRIAVEAVKVPVEASLLFGVISLFDKRIINIINKINNRWENVNI